MFACSPGMTISSMLDLEMSFADPLRGNLLDIKVDRYTNLHCA